MNNQLVMNLLRQLELQKLQAQIDFLAETNLEKREKLNRDICGLNQIIQTYLEN